MELDVRINEDDTEAAIYFPEPAPGYTLLFNAEQLDEFLGILIDLRRRMHPPPGLPGESPLEEDDDDE